MAGKMDQTQCADDRRRPGDTESFAGASGGKDGRTDVCAEAA